MAYTRVVLCFCLLFLIVISSARDLPKSTDHTAEKEGAVEENGPPIVCRKCPPRKTPPAPPSGTATYSQLNRRSVPKSHPNPTCYCIRPSGHCC